MNENTSLISIIMPAYNAEKYIAQSINSVISQTHTDWELIVIDDGSQDGTLHIIESYCEKDSRIKVMVNETNMGVSMTRNKGIDFSVGDWIAFLDSDDLWDPFKLEKQLKAANEKRADFLFTGSSYINVEGEFFSGIFEVPEKVTYKKLRKQNVISCSSVLVKKKYFENIKMEKDDMHEDYAVWLRILKLGITAHGVNEPLLIYRISKNSKSGKKINTIKMTYKVFRFIGINPIGSAYYMTQHILRSIIKYSKIKNT